MSEAIPDLARLRHDLCSPLAVVCGFAEILASGEPLDDADRRAYAARIVEAALEMRTLIARSKLC